MSSPILANGAADNRRARRISGRGRETSIQIFMKGGLPPTGEEPAQHPFGRNLLYDIWRSTLCSPQANRSFGGHTHEARNCRHVVAATGAARRYNEAALCRGWLFARHVDLPLAQGSSRPYRHVRPY